jgi:hypothetical protein
MSGLSVDNDIYMGGVCLAPVWFSANIITEDSQGIPPRARATGEYPGNRDRQDNNSDKVTLVLNVASHFLAQKRM